MHLIELQMVYHKLATVYIKYINKTKQNDNKTKAQTAPAQDYGLEQIA